jgi:electron transport complex protein RnfG
MSVSGGHAPKSASLSSEMAADAPPPPEVRPLRLVVVLASFGAACGLTLAVAFRWTQPRIEAYQTRRTEEAVREVLKGPDRITSLYVSGGTLTDRAPAGVDPAKLDRVYVGYDRAGKRIGFAIPAKGPGFQDDMRLIFGFDPANEQLIGMKVVEERETPGIGDRIEKDVEFVKEFTGPRAPIEGVKPGRGQGNAHAVDTITGATISSRAVIAIINKRVQALAPALESYMQQPGGAR